MADRFLEAALAPLSMHAAGTLDEARETIPAFSERDVFAAAVLGDDERLAQILHDDPDAARRKGGPRGWDALTHLCFSRYLRLEPHDGFVRCARLLLDAGAPADTGFNDGQEWDTAIYGACGVAHHAGLTRLLLERGADPNDGEAAYHSPEGYDNEAMQALVESGRVTAENLATMLGRKSDWHDLKGITWLLEHGADPNFVTRWGRTALHQAILRENSADIVRVMMAHGADPSIAVDGTTPRMMAARWGHRAALEIFGVAGLTGADAPRAPDAPRGAEVLRGADALLAACALDRVEQIEEMRRFSAEVLENGATHLARFSSLGNTEGVGHLLDLGVRVDASFAGDGYWELAADTSALHVAAWRARHDTVALLLSRGAPVNAADARGRTPLMLAVRACVDSWWTRLRAPDSVRLLLQAGASKESVPYPCGYDEVDALLAPARS